MYLKEATFMINGCDTQAQVQGDFEGGWSEYYGDLESKSL